MVIDHIKLKNFRNRIDFDVEFNSHINLIVGNNGAGKTSILEAISTISTTKSFKAKKEIEVINHDEDFAYIDILIRNGEKENLKIILQKLNESRVKKTYSIDDSNKRAGTFIGKLLTVLFTTDLINSFNDSSLIRRKFFNQFLCQLDREYLEQLSIYEKVIKNKTKLLKMIKSGSNNKLLDYWNNELVKSGTIIVKKRYEFINNLESFLLSHNDKEEFLMRNINVRYISKYENNDLIEDFLMQDLLMYAPYEIDSTRCLIGPHKDDYDVFFNRKNIKTFASRGEQKFSIAFLLYAIARYIDENTKNSPVILLDDLAAEMDNKNLSTIFELFISTNYQIIITSIIQDLYKDKADKIIELK